LVTFSIYIIDIRNPIIIKISLKYRKGTLEYDPEFNSLKKSIATKNYRPLKNFLPQNLYSPETHQFFKGNESLREYCVLETNNSSEESPLREMNFLENKI
jgi:hypothetical protein